MYGKIISENKNNIKGEKIFIAVYRAADETVGTKAVFATAGGAEYAGGDEYPAHIHMVSAGVGQSIVERILLYDDVHGTAHRQIL